MQKLQGKGSRHCRPAFVYWFVQVNVDQLDLYSWIFFVLMLWLKQVNLD